MLSWECWNPPSLEIPGDLPSENSGLSEISDLPRWMSFSSMQRNLLRTPYLFRIGRRKTSPVKIGNYFMKLALPYIENSLAFLFNTSFETSQFPDSWKVARITPIFKGGDRTEKSNYRPISVLPVISKLFEKLVFNQLYQYMKENGLFTSEESGFLRQHSTLTCLLKQAMTGITGSWLPVYR